MDLSIAIVSWNTRDILAQCLGSITDTASGIDLETIVVDNASTDGSADMIRSRYPDVRLIENTDNVGFAKGNNQAFEVSRGKYFLLLNPDTICLPGALNDLADFMADNPRVGAVGPLVLNDDRTLQYSWARFPTVLGETVGKLDRRIEGIDTIPQTADDVRALTPFQADWIGGCCFLIRRSAVEEIGLMDESFFMYSEETDWCYRLKKAGWEVWLNPRSEIIHLGGKSSEQRRKSSNRALMESKVRFFNKHYGPTSARMLEVLLSIKACLKRCYVRD